MTAHYYLPYHDVPLYPALGPSVEKWRRLDRKRPLTKEETKAYGAAVLAAIRRLQRQEALRGLSGGKPPSPVYETGAELLARLRDAQARALHTGHPVRSDAVLRAAYDEAMQEKRAAAQPS